MEFLIGLGLALAIALAASFVGLDRDRSFYSTMLIVIVSYYGLFAVMGGSTQTLLLESIPIAAFLVLSLLGFKRSQWFLVAGLLGHGAFDFFHGHVIANSGVPPWWPKFCLSFDVAAGAYLAWLLRHRRAERERGRS